MLARLKLDPFMAALIAVLVAATVLPVGGQLAGDLKIVANVAIATLFFLHGARLTRTAVVASVTHWRMHLFVLATTFAVFPAIGLLAGLFLPAVLGETLFSGVIFLCILSSTVQMSITLTSVAGGSVAAAISSATLSNILGMVLTPLLAGVLLHAAGAGLSLDALGSIFLQLLLPFVAGQALQPWIGKWVAARRHIFAFTDRGSILLVVYLAFSKAVREGVWHDVSWFSFIALLAVIAVLLALVLTFIRVGSGALGFSREDRIAMTFCGSQKSLVSGIPIAGVLFTGPEAGLIVVPLMLYHQTQMLVCVVLARRYADEGKRLAAAALKA